MESGASEGTRPIVPAQPQLFKYDVRASCRRGWNCLVISIHPHFMSGSTHQTVMHCSHVTSQNVCSHTT